LSRLSVDLQRQGFQTVLFQNSAGSVVTTRLVYFFPEDAKDAYRIAAAVTRICAAVTTTPVATAFGRVAGGKIAKGHFELWLSRDAILGVPSNAGSQTGTEASAGAQSSGQQPAAQTTVQQPAENADVSQQNAPRTDLSQQNAPQYPTQETSLTYQAFARSSSGWDNGNSRPEAIQTPRQAVLHTGSPKSRNCFGSFQTGESTSWDMPAGKRPLPMPTGTNLRPCELMAFDAICWTRSQNWREPCYGVREISRGCPDDPWRRLSPTIQNVPRPTKSASSRTRVSSSGHSTWVLLVNRSSTRFAD
jgi:hypothetical protein